VKPILSIVCLVATASLAQVPARLPAVALMQLQSKALDAEGLEVLGSTLASELLATNRVRVLERSQVDQILKEQGFQQSGACDAGECAVEIGKLLTVEKMVVGSVGRLGAVQSLSLRMVDVGTGEVTKSVSKSCECPQEAVLTRLAPQAVRELLGVAEVSPVVAVPKADFSGKRGKFKDLRDGTSYPWIRVGEQVWMARNLEWDTVGSVCYQGKSGNGSAYGRLYPWDLARRACPAGWHLPIQSEWESLVQAAGGAAKAGTSLKDDRLWDGENALGMKILPAGRRTGSGEFASLEGTAYLWTGTLRDSANAFHWVFTQGSPRAAAFGESRLSAYSVRCVLDR